jgi:hypothetical protein
MNLTLPLREHSNAMHTFGCDQDRQSGPQQLASERQLVLWRVMCANDETEELSRRQNAHLVREADRTALG